MTTWLPRGFALLLFGLPFVPIVAAAPDDAEIARLIKQLSDDEFQKREKATTRLKESGEPALNKRAIAYLNDASRAEGRESQVWHFLAIAYGRDNQMGMAALSLAEEALANGKKKDATQQAMRAKQILPKGLASYLRADEIGRQAELLDK